MGTTRSRGASTRASSVRGGALLAVAAAVLAVACTTPPPPLPGGSRDVVVFDIDGTLTTDELATSAHAGAANAVNAYVAKGYNVVYVTARWKVALESSTRQWLVDNGFPSRPLYMPDTLLIDDQSKVDYKTSALRSIEQGDPEVRYAYGDSSSDFVAYANVGVPQANVYALKRASASSCQPGTYAVCMNDYVAHLSFINGLPAAS
jgi:phosphatidate phosphatase PAH1